MNRRHFLHLGLSGLAASALSGCSLDSLCGLGGNAACNSNEKPLPEPDQLDNKNTRVKCYYSDKLFVMLTPDFHLVTRYRLPKVLFNLPASLLEKAYLQYGPFKNQDTVFRGFGRFSGRYTETAFSANLLWKASELNAQEQQLLENILSFQESLRGGWVTLESKYQLSIRKGTLEHAYNQKKYHDEGIDMNRRVAALRGKDEVVYELSQLAGASVSEQSPMAQIYAPSAYPNGFFAQARAATYQPARKNGQTGYAWQNRSSPVRIDANGQVTLNGKVLTLLNARSPFADV